MIRFRLIPVLALMAGCAADRYAGLLPVAPDPARPDVEERRPELRWEALVPPRGATDIVYDLRVYETTGESEVYAVEDLPGCAHRLERDLVPATTYRWTVRARFRLDGAPRLTPWTQVVGADRDGTVSPARAVAGVPLRVR